MPKQESAKILARLDRAAANGPPKSGEQFHGIKPTRGAYEFKTYNWRIFCFRDGPAFVCTHIASKNTLKAKDYARHEATVIEVREDYFRDKQRHALEVRD